MPTFIHDSKFDTAELEEFAARARRMAEKTRARANRHADLSTSLETRAQYWEAQAAQAEERFRRRVESTQP